MLAGVTPFNLDGKPVMLTGVTGPLPGNGGNGASADKTGPLSRLGVFANGQGSFGDQDATSREPGFDFHTAGLTVGADYRILDPLVVGLAFGYLRTNTSTDAAAGDSRVNGYSFSIYGNYYVLPKLYIDAIVMGGWNDSNVKRNTPTGVAEAEPGGNQFSIGSSVGYDFSMAGFTFGPTARVAYVRIHIDGYQETGAGPSNSRVGSQTVESVTTDLGGQINYAISFGWGVLSPLLRFEWEHEYKGGSRIVNAGLVSDPATSVAFATSKPDRDYFNLGAGITATLPVELGRSSTSKSRLAGPASPITPSRAAWESSSEERSRESQFESAAPSGPLVQAAHRQGLGKSRRVHHAGERRLECRAAAHHGRLHCYEHAARHSISPRAGSSWATAM